MSNFVKWIKNGVTSLLEPEREARIERNTNALHHELTTLGRKFSIERSPANEKLSGAEYQEVKERVFKRILTKAWADESVGADEQKTLMWLANALQLDSQVVSRLHGTFAKAHFQRAFAEAMEDGVISEAEYARLDRIAKSVNTTVPKLFRAYFSESAETIFRAVFATIVEDGVISEAEWNRLWLTAEQLGITHDELLSILQPQAQTFVEHVLTDAKEDEVLSPTEDALLTWLLTSFHLNFDFVAYVEREVNSLRILTNAANGILPSISGRGGIELRAGEILHHCEPAKFRTVKLLKSGPRVDMFGGICFVTDSRFVFSAAEKSVSLNLRSILECIPGQSGVEIRSSAKGAGEYVFQDNPRVAATILRTAIGRANQTIVQRQSELPGRHIPREVRQRVWQTYGGRCAECKSEQYLEYDHIIPVAKGGSSLENNVQLLCRKCNLLKSDRI